MAIHTMDFVDWDRNDWVAEVVQFLVNCGVATIVNTVYDTSDPPKILEQTFTIRGHNRIFRSYWYTSYNSYYAISVRKLDGVTSLRTLVSIQTSTSSTTNGTIVCCENANSVVVFFRNVVADSFIMLFVCTKDEHGNPLVLDEGNAYVYNNDETWYIGLHTIGQLGVANYVCCPAIIKNDGGTTDDTTLLYALAPFIFSIQCTDPWQRIQYLTSVEGEFVYYIYDIQYGYDYLVKL